MLLKSIPFALCFVLVPIIAMATVWGGWWLFAPFAFGWFVIPLMDKVMSLDTDNMDPATRDDLLLWHRAVTYLWVPVQTALIVFVLWQATDGHLSGWESVAAALGLGMATGGIGITFAHEMVHQKSRWERWAGEFLLVAVGYGHFATEHVFGHHINVATPGDPVSARKGENLYAFLPRAIGGSFVSAWRIDRERLARRGRAVWHRTNPFWRYGIGVAGWIAVAALIGGWWAIGLWAVQAAMAIFQLEAVNYVEHYGLSRRQGANGKFERVRPHHSWNAAHRFSNWLLINLQRHSDHHHRPDRRFPLLQHHDEANAPQLPLSYSMMIAIATNPPLWHRIMDARVDEWRETFYPGETDWADYERPERGFAVPV